MANYEILNHKINYKNKIYNISIEDKIHEIYKRINKYDLYTQIDINEEDYINGFNINLYHTKKYIKEFIKPLKESSLVYENYGLPIWSNKSFGNLYINFRISEFIN